jgi:metal-responsive CopG/Arc/MetJ family transcriptional regulator
MPRFYNRKIEIRFEDSAIEEIDEVAAKSNLSRAEFIRKATVNALNVSSQSQGSTVATKPALTVSAYHALVQHVYRSMGGSIAHIQIETCVAIVLKQMSTS